MRNRFLFIMFAAANLWAGIFYVSPGGDNTNDGSSVMPFATINRGVQAAADGDTVLLLQGHYREHNIRISDKNLHITSSYIFSADTGLVSSTIVDGENASGSIFYCDNTNKTFFTGFSITGGGPDPGNGAGGAVYAGLDLTNPSAYLQFTKMHFYDNAGSPYGPVLYGGIARYDSCDIFSNGTEAVNEIFAQCNVSFFNCRFFGNHGNTLVFNTNSTDTMKLGNCKIFDNELTISVFRSMSTIRIDSCTIYGNIASNIAGTRCCIYNSIMHDNSVNHLFSGGPSYVNGCLLFRNTSQTSIETGANIYFSNSTIACPLPSGNLTNAGSSSFINCILFPAVDNCSYSRITAAYSLMFNLRAENLSEKRGWDASLALILFFRDTAAGDFHLSGYSPAVDAAHPDSAFDLEIWGSRRNMGFYGNTDQAARRKFTDPQISVHPSPVVHNVFPGQICRDIITIINSGIDTFMTCKQDEITASAFITSYELSNPLVPIAPGDSFLIWTSLYLPSDLGSYSGSMTVPLAYGNSSAQIEFSGTTLDRIVDNSWVFKISPVGIATVDTFWIHNYTEQPLQIDRFVSSSPELTDPAPVGVWNGYIGAQKHDLP